MKRWIFGGAAVVFVLLITCVGSVLSLMRSAELPGGYKVANINGVSAICSPDGRTIIPDHPDSGPDGPSVVEMAVSGPLVMGFVIDGSRKTWFVLDTSCGRTWPFLHTEADFAKCLKELGIDPPPRLHFATRFCL
jgi:hypothetical protein